MDLLLILTVEVVLFLRKRSGLQYDLKILDRGHCGTHTKLSQGEGKGK